VVTGVWNGRLSTTEDGSLTALLGASPGASNTVNTKMIGILERLFQERFSTLDWQAKQNNGASSTVIT